MNVERVVVIEASRRQGKRMRSDRFREHGRGICVNYQSAKI